MTERSGRRRRTATPGWSPTGRGSPSRRCCSATAPAAASTPATWRRWPRDLPAHGITVVLFEQPWRVAGKKVATAAGDARRRPAAAAAVRLRTAPLVVGGRVGGRAVAPPRCATSSAPSAAWRCRSRCTRPGGPRSPGSHELPGAGCRRWWSRASGTRSGRPEEFPADRRLAVRARRRPRLRGAEAARRSTPGRGARASSWRRRWSGSVREVAGNQLTGAERVPPPCWPCCRTETC